MKKTNKYTYVYMPLGMLLGISFGIIIYGIPSGNIALGVALGICLGMCLGIAIGAAKDAKINKQLEEFGYTVKSVSQTPDGYDLTVTDKSGADSAVPISSQTQAHEKFKPGDLVYLSGSKVEQAYRSGEGE